MIRGLGHEEAFSDADQVSRICAGLRDDRSLEGMDIRTSSHR